LDESQFMKVLGRMTRRWFLDEIDRIRIGLLQEEDNGGVIGSFRPGIIRRFCPITAVYYYVKGVAIEPGRFETAARELGLPWQLARDIVAAADRDPGHKDTMLRAKLLEACGLRERRKGDWVDRVPHPGNL